ncbi:MAG: phosphoribosyltransferase [Candidatus Gracilibacteria bacterium]
MSALDRDPNGVLVSMKENCSYVDGIHVVYKASTHGRRYLDKDAHLKQPGVAKRVIELLSQGIIPGAVIIAPETSAETNLGQEVARLIGADCIPTKKVADKHTFNPEHLRGLHGRHPRILIDDILNNGATLEQIQEALGGFGLTIDQFRVMVDRNPEKSSQLGVPVSALATVQMDQWNESDVPDDLKQQSITTKLGKARNWILKDGNQPNGQFLLERLHKERFGFHLDDGMKVGGSEEESLILIPR